MSHAMSALNRNGENRYRKFGSLSMVTTLAAQASSPMAPCDVTIELSYPA